MSKDEMVNGGDHFNVHHVRNSPAFHDEAQLPPHLIDHLDGDVRRQGGRAKRRSRNWSMTEMIDVFSKSNSPQGSNSSSPSPSLSPVPQSHRRSSLGMKTRRRKSSNLSVSIPLSSLCRADLQSTSEILEQEYITMRRNLFNGNGNGNISHTNTGNNNNTIGTISNTSSRSSSQSSLKRMVNTDSKSNHLPPLSPNIKRSLDQGGPLQRTSSLPSIEMAEKSATSSNASSRRSSACSSPLPPIRSSRKTSLPMHMSLLVEGNHASIGSSSLQASPISRRKISLISGSRQRSLSTTYVEDVEDVEPVSLPPSDKDQYVSCANTKPLHGRNRKVGPIVKKHPLHRVFKTFKKRYGDVRVLRVGGGFVIVSDDWEKFFATSELEKTLKHGTDPKGITVLGGNSDGSLTLSNGAKVIMNGEDEDLVGDAESEVETTDEFSDSYGSEFDFEDERDDNLESDDDIDGTDDEFNCNDLDNTPCVTAVPIDQLSNLGESGDSDDNAAERGDEHDIENESGNETDVNKRLNKPMPKQAITTWELDHEVVNVDDDGTKGLVDGTVVHSDGTITMSDGSKIPQDEAHELAMRRKHKNWPEDNSLEARRKKMSLPKWDNDANDAIEPFRTTQIILDEMLTLAPEDEDSGIINALDYLSRYCIISQSQANKYMNVFKALDRDNDGSISVVELDFGLKTVNKELISHQEISYVTTVLDVNQSDKKSNGISSREFALISALSERVVGLDKFVKQLVNTMDLGAFKKKVRGCKDLFYILDEQKRGVVGVDDMRNELVAGRLSKEHEHLVLDKLCEGGQEEIHFLDFLKYLPLFVEIHDTINSNPFETTRDK
eukprot:m.13382 g.13382  ORF g.13382 m.13382 type:complete len:835 (-) comp4148_c0_seq2:122-2626(-)